MNVCQITAELPFIAKILDLSIIENVWKLLADEVCNVPLFNNNIELETKLQKTVTKLNELKMYYLGQIYKYLNLYAN